MEAVPVLEVGAMLRIHHMVVEVFRGRLDEMCSVCSGSLRWRVGWGTTSDPSTPGRGRK